MTPTPAEFEIKQRPVCDPAPGTACIWQCIKDMPLSMHRLSDGVLGGLYIAIDSGLIKKSNCNLNESDLSESFKIRVIRSELNLGRGLLTPDGKAVISIPIKRESKTVLFELRGAGKTNLRLPAIVYNADIFKERYPNWAEWRDELLYKRGLDGTLDVEDFESYPGNPNDSTPPDWPQGLTRDRNLASEIYYRLNNMNPKTGLPKDTANTGNNVRNPYATRSQMLSIAEMIDEKYGTKDRIRKRTSVAIEDAVIITDSEDEIDTLARPKKRKKGTFVEPMHSEMPNRPKSPPPVTAPIEIHKAAFQAAFRDKSVRRTDLFKVLLPFISVADAEEILVRCQCVAAVISESKFE
ncbi:hypothetical protein V493_05970 [Pseudogymnoascus sp. VKM F-4281 (FW-2241)]|nr:hypothetical protein V493_05970 [Pseudogymnoascus sp. VKM F-4281 (FW-2241)]